MLPLVAVLGILTGEAVTGGLILAFSRGGQPQPSGVSTENSWRNNLRSHADVRVEPRPNSGEGRASIWDVFNAALQPPTCGVKDAQLVTSREAGVTQGRQKGFEVFKLPFVTTNVSIMEREGREPDERNAMSTIATLTANVLRKVPIQNDKVPASSSDALVDRRQRRKGAPSSGNSPNARRKRETAMSEVSPFVSTSRDDPKHRNPGIMFGALMAPVMFLLWAMVVNERTDLREELATELVAAMKERKGRKKKGRRRRKLKRRRAGKRGRGSMRASR